MGSYQNFMFVLEVYIVAVFDSVLSHDFRCLWCCCVVHDWSMVLCFNVLLCCGPTTSAKQGFPLTATATVKYPRAPCLRIIYSGLTSMKVAATLTRTDRIRTLFWMTWPADVSTAPPQLPPPTLPCPSVPWRGGGQPRVEGAPGPRSL